MSTREETTLDEIRVALHDSNVRIALVHTFTHGRGAQVYIKTRKIGPLILPAEGEDLSNVLAMLGRLAIEGTS